MRLFDVATVVENDDHWPTVGDARACESALEVGTPCPPGGTPVDPIEVATAAVDTDGRYEFRPFYLDAMLSRSVACAMPDDDTWLARRLREASEFSLLNWLMESDDSPFASPALGGGAATTAGGKFATLRENWQRASADESNGPIFFVNPLLVKALASDQMVHFDGKEDLYTAWGDPVILTYASAPMTVTVSSEMTIYLSSVENALANLARGNNVENRANRIASVDTVPCLVGEVAITP